MQESHLTKFSTVRCNSITPLLKSNIDTEFGKGSDLPSVLHMEAVSVATSKHSTSFVDILVAVNQRFLPPMVVKCFTVN